MTEVRHGSHVTPRPIVALLGLVVLMAGCNSAAVATLAPPPSAPSSPEAAFTAAPTAAPTPPVAPTAQLSASPLPIPAPVAPPTANPTRSADATPHVVKLSSILAVAQADRFETFGDKPIRLEQIWSPNDTGLGGTCGATNVPWLECGLADWLIQTFEDGAGCPFTTTTFCYEGPRLDILYEPGMSERLGPGDGPVDLIGHFGDPASEGCRPENRDVCRDEFVVTAIEQAGP